MFDTIRTAEFDSGHLRGRYPYVRVGEGPDTMLIVPGLNDPLRRVTEGWWFSSLVATFCERYATGRTVYAVSRPPNLPSDTSTEDMAAGYAEVLDEIGPGTVFGLSMGGFVVQQLAASSPDLVERAILGLTADRLSDAGAAIVRRWERRARAGEWSSIYADGAGLIADGPRRRAFRVAARLVATIDREPSVPADFLVTTRACLEHDGGPLLPETSVPTLVVGGTDDAFFTPAQYRRTARDIPDATLCMLDGAGHEAAIERKRAFDGAIGSFLNQS